MSNCCNSSKFYNVNVHDDLVSSAKRIYSNISNIFLHARLFPPKKNKYPFVNLLTNFTSTILKINIYLLYFGEDSRACKNIFESIGCSSVAESLRSSCTAHCKTE